jgi:hypothetical protein
MGLLDDAIREHLDLKRRRGADPADIERDEREALGPVRRKGGEAPASAESEPGLGVLIEADETEHALLDADELPAGDALADDPPPLHLADDEDPLDDDEPLPEDGQPLPEDDEHATRVMRIPDEEPAPPAAAPPQPAMSDATAEFDVEEALVGEDDEDDEDSRADAPREDEPGDGEEDVLEETPEFLQDTPDHDRLWFEQRPPRDFDFDG